MTILLTGDASFRQRVTQVIGELDYGFESIVASHSGNAQSVFKKCAPDITVLQATLSGVSTIENLKMFKKLDPEATVILCGPVPDSAMTISALNSGAFYFVIEPVDKKNMNIALRKAICAIEYRYKRKNIADSDVNSIDTIPKTSIQETLNWIDENYGNDLSLNEAAEKANMSTSYFCSQFKEETGMSFKEYLINIRISNAKQLLSATDKHVNSIAQLVGYSNPNYFSSVFSDIEGCTPSEYRRLEKLKNAASNP